MSRFLVLSLIVASLSTIVGCGATSQHVTAAPSSTLVAERDESSWTPPDEMALSINEPAAEAPKRKAKGVTFRPNRDRPARGAVHAATY